MVGWVGGQLCGWVLRLAGGARTFVWMDVSVRVCVSVCGCVCLYSCVHICDYVFVIKNVMILCFISHSNTNDLISYPFQEKSSYL